jgi:hypothetical protein
VIEEIWKLMLRSEESVYKGELNRRNLAIVEGKKQKKKKKQQHSWRGERGQLQKRIWDPGGFKNWGTGDNEKELMFFLAREYDVGSFIDVNNAPTRITHQARIRSGEAPTLSF